jgi:arylsulfatase A-like enzyme
VERREQRPFFAFLNYYEAHEPYLPPSPFDTMFGPAGLRRLDGTVQGMRLAFPPNRQSWSVEEHAAEKRAYDASLAYLDSELGKLFDELRARDLLKNTIVIVTSDHGEQFGEHGLFVHGNSLYSQNTVVPFIIAYPPGVAAGAVAEYPVTTSDIPATIADLAGFGAGAPFPGTSVFASRDRTRPVLGEVLPLEDKTAPARLRGQLRSLVSDSLHWLLNADGSEELYDWRTDPAEVTNLVGESNASLRAALRARLDSTLRANPATRDVGVRTP